MANKVNTSCGTYTKDELVNWVSFAKTAEELHGFEDVLERIRDELPKTWLEEIDLELMMSWDSYFADEFANSYMGSCYGDYSPGNPWNAPGMSVSDFI